MQTSSPSPLVPPPQGSGVVFVTGAGGFIGRHAVSAFREAGWTVAGFGPAPRFDDVPGLLAPHHADHDRVGVAALRGAAEALAAPKVIVHAAGSGSVGASIADPAADLERNVGSLQPVLSFLRADAPDARLVFLSSAAVYGADHTGPIGEAAAVNPVSPYGRHKLQAEALIAEAAAKGLDAVSLRLFSVYGPGLRKQLLWDIARRLLGGVETLTLDGAGDERRDFLAVEDAVRLIGLAATTPKAPLLVNGATGAWSSVEQIARLAVAACARPVEINFTGLIRKGDPPSLYADMAAARALGFQPATPLAEGVAAFLSWAHGALGPKA